MSDKNLFINDLLHRFTGYSFTESQTNDRYTVAFKDGSSVTQAEAQGLNLVDAYRKIRADVLDADEPLYQSTTTERDALTDIEASTVIDNITIGRTEIYDGTAWKSAARRSVAAAITASTTQTQGNGQLSYDINIITTVANNNDTVTLPTAAKGIFAMVVNAGTKKLKIFPSSSDDLGGGVNSSVALAAGSSVIFHCYDSTTWVMM